MSSLLALLITIIKLYQFVLIAYVILTSLIAFNVIQTSNPLMQSLIHTLHTLSDPSLRLLRKFIPLIRGIDLSPIVILLLLSFLQNLLFEIWPTT